MTFSEDLINSKMDAEKKHAEKINKQKNIIKELDDQKISRRITT